MKNNLYINTLTSFNELTEEDQEKCQKVFERPLPFKEENNKYFKLTQEIIKKFENETQEKSCFLTFQTISLNISYSALIFSLCGLFDTFHLIIYAAVLDDAKLSQKEQFIGDIVKHLIETEVPKLKQFSVKFVLLQNNLINQNVVKILSDMEQSVCSDYLFIADPGYWRYSNLHNPYAQNACFEILNTMITRKNIEGIFNKYKDIAKVKDLDYLGQFVNDYYKLALLLLAAKSSVTLHLCTLERLDNFQKIIRSHMEPFKEQRVTRTLIFQLLRALIIIYDR
ncbi:uncharacterized protein LOC108096240 [Drosophila ficusphila]|uniref:uncharacterized protein LOC108096240 n=1 Tax=Drosophila ficusphila TaxID=30025 RepID=UPI0007E74C9F|nr:uncharacterized protein LOC108096240 [Drosophila ficusphila]